LRSSCARAMKARSLLLRAAASPVSEIAAEQVGPEPAYASLFCHGGVPVGRVEVVVYKNPRRKGKRSTSALHCARPDDGSSHRSVADRR
jgi:hypothetical protein